MFLYRYSAFFFLALAGAPPAPAQMEESLLEAEGRTNGKSTLEIVEKEREILQRTGAVIQDDREPISNGTVMTSDGLILTKGSILKTIKKPSVRLDRTLYEEVAILGYDEDSDLALIKIKATDLTVPLWGSPPAAGTVVIANGSTTRTKRRAKIGVVSALTRPIPPVKVPALLGVAFAPDQGLRIEQVYPLFAADNAGLKAGDILLSLDGAAVKTTNDVTRTLAPHTVGETVPATIKRDQETLNVKIRFIAPPASRNDQMSGRFHTRRDNFPECIQHDIPLSIYNAGGPLLNRNGETVGINIARVNRAESLALSAKSVRNAFQKLLKQSEKKK